MQRDQQRHRRTATRSDAQQHPHTPICYPTRYPQAGPLEPPSHQNRPPQGQTLQLLPVAWSHCGSKNAVKVRLTPTQRTVHAHALGEPASLVTVIPVTNAETEITADLVRDLLRDQHPDLADRPLSLGARGWDNQL